MQAALQLIGKLRGLGNSPTHERDVATMFTAPRLGVWFFFLNAVLMLAVGGVFMLLSEESRYSSFEGDVFEEVGLGEGLTSVIFLSLTVFLTIFVPIRVVGPIMGPRMGRYFDQIVLSGISPSRYFAGKILAQNVFLAVVIIATLPYFVLCISLGGISITFALLGILILAVFTNLVAVCTLFFSVFNSEIASILLSFVVFSTAFIVGLIPFVPNPFALSTSSVFMAPLYQQLLADMDDDVAEITELLWGVGPGFAEGGFLMTQVTIFLIIATVVAAVCVLYLVLGPMNCIVRENSTFGEVVLKGDSKKRSYLKRRPLLRLRSELSFFYENRPAWMRRWDFLFRWCLSEVFFLLGLVIPFAAIGILAMGIRTDDEETVLWAMFVGSIWLFINNAFFLKDKSTERLRHRGLEAGQIDLLFYFANLVMIAFAASLFLSMCGEAMDRFWTSSYGRYYGAAMAASPRPPVWHLPGFAFGTCLFVIGFELHWFLRFF